MWAIESEAAEDFSSIARSILFRIIFQLNYSFIQLSTLSLARFRRPLPSLLPSFLLPFSLVL